ncbi:MAG TPA: PIG-L deacetylase family protein [Actinotalea caeni]|uniref:PIG-L deacetylase family protein n=1 Tax=Actinotalea caeni TaxID=1348467 RepID=UPI0012E1A103|nr:PIG-L deacetylase family protein [Actinotalea caeni]HLV55110.1 PIG-L deacetylase family protein [Actinotalea caeni]
MDAPQLAPLPEDWDSALAIVAHPDDMEYGMSAAVARWTAQGKTVSYLLVTRGEAGIDTMPPEETVRVRAAEQRAACDAVGVETLEYLDHPDGVIHDVMRLRRDIAAAVRRHRPDVVLTGSPRDFFPGGMYNMADHRIVGYAVLDGVRDAANRWVFTDLTGPDGEPLEKWDGVRFTALGGSTEPSHAVDVTDTLEAGIASLRAHESYLAALDWHPDPAEMLRSFTEQAAPSFGGRPAVTFEVIGLQE